MARIKKGIRSRDALRVPFASLTTPFVCPAEPGRPPRLAPRRPRCARVLIAARALSGGRGRPSRSPCRRPLRGARSAAACLRCGARRWRACDPLRGGCSLAPNHCCRGVVPAWFAPLARSSATGGAGCPVAALLRSAGTAVVSPPVTGLVSGPVSGDSSLAARFAATRSRRMFRHRCFDGRWTRRRGR